MGRHFFGAQKRLQLATADGQRRQVALHSTPQPDQLLTTEEIRVRLGLPSLDAVYRLVRDYGLPRTRVGGVYRFSLNSVNAWIAEQNQSPRPIGA